MQQQVEQYDARSMVTNEPMSTATVLQQPLQHPPIQTLSSQKPIDLSCHEVDMSMDCGTTPADLQNVTADIVDSQGTGNACCCRNLSMTLAE